MEEVVKIDGIKYRRLAQFENTTKMEEYVEECKDRKYNVFIVKPSNMWTVYGHKQPIREEVKTFENIVSVTD